MRNYFLYNGTNSIDMDIHIQSKSVYSAPKYDLTMTSIPGRCGELPSGNGRFLNGTVSYTCFVPARSIEELSYKLTRIKNWLYADIGNYHVLEDTYETDYIRYGIFNNKLDIKDEANKIGTFTITFSVKPFKYLKSGLNREVYSGAFSVTNPYSFEAKPYLKISGSGNVSVTIKNKTWNISHLNGYIECDSELMNWYKGTEPKNSSVTGDGFPTLDVGTTSFFTVGNVTTIELIPRWVTL